jgi:hypothetical protein
VATPLTAHQGCTGKWGGGGGQSDVGVGEGPDADLPAMLSARYSVHSFTLEVEMTAFRAPFWPVMLNRAHANDGLGPGVDPGQCQWQGQHNADAVAAGGRL